MQKPDGACCSVSFVSPSTGSTTNSYIFVTYCQLLVFVFSILRVVETLVKQKAKLKTVKDGITPIHMALQKGYIDVVKVLLCAYPDEVNTPDENGRTPLHLAAKLCPEIVTELLKR